MALDRKCVDSERTLLGTNETTRLRAHVEVKLMHQNFITVTRVEGKH